MKKLMTLMLGLSLAFGAVATAFAADAPQRNGGKKTRKGGGRKHSKGQAPKRGSGS